MWEKSKKNKNSTCLMSSENLVTRHCQWARGQGLRWEVNFEDGVGTITKISLEALLVLDRVEDTTNVEEVRFINQKVINFEAVETIEVAVVEATVNETMIQSWTNLGWTITWDKRFSQNGGSRRKPPRRSSTQISRPSKPRRSRSTGSSSLPARLTSATILDPRPPGWPSSRKNPFSKTLCAKCATYFSGRKLSWTSTRPSTRHAASTAASSPPIPKF